MAARLTVTIHQNYLKGIIRLRQGGPTPWFNGSSPGISFIPDTTSPTLWRPHPLLQRGLRTVQVLLMPVFSCDLSCKQPSDENLFVSFITWGLLELRNTQQSASTDRVLLCVRAVAWLRLPDHHRGQWAGPSPGLPWWVYSATACRQSTSRDSSAPRESAVRTRRWQTGPCPLRSWTEQPVGHLEGPCCRSVRGETYRLRRYLCKKKKKTHKQTKDSLVAPLSVQINQVQSEAQRKRKQSIHPSATKIQRH